jgi:hypothetical protein
MRPAIPGSVASGKRARTDARLYPVANVTAGLSSVTVSIQRRKRIRTITLIRNSKIYQGSRLAKTFTLARVGFSHHSW